MAQIIVVDLEETMKLRIRRRALKHGRSRLDGVYDSLGK